jgi:hypothetical protein
MLSQAQRRARAGRTMGAMNTELDAVPHYGFCIDELYQYWRTHLSLHKDAPETRTVHPETYGEIVKIAEVGGLHHHYERRAA